MRSTMGGERLSGLCLISVERDLSYMYGLMQNSENMVDDFAKKGTEECIYGYKKTKFSMK